MANDTYKPWRQDFDESTNVMESGLLRVLTDKSASVTGGWRALDEDLEAEVIVEPPTTPRTTPLPVAAAPPVEVLAPLVPTVADPSPPVATSPPPLPPVATTPDLIVTPPSPPPLATSPPIATAPSPPIATPASPPMATPSRAAEPTLAVALEPPARRRSGIMTVALVVAVVVLAADVAMYALHRRQLAHQPLPAPPPLPTYMVLPEATPPAVLQPVQTMHAAPEVAPAEPSVAPAKPAVLPAPPPADAKPHSHHHRHAKSTR